MKLAVPYPAELLRVARKLVWYDKPESYTGTAAKTLISSRIPGKFSSHFHIAVIKPKIRGGYTSKHETSLDLWSAICPPGRC